MPSVPRWREQLSKLTNALRSRWVVRALLAMVVVAVAGYFLRDSILGTPADIAEVTRGELVQTVVASGRIMTPQRVSVSALVTERVARIPVAEGSDVRRGDVLMLLDDADERAAMAQAQASVAQAEAKVRQLREVGLPGAQQTLAQTQANQVQAEQQFARAKDLKAKGFLSQAALDDAKRNLDVAQSQLESSRLQVDSNRPTGSDFVLAQAALQQARATLEAARARLDQTVIRASVDGTLIARSVEPGDVVQPGKELMVLAPAGETQIVVSVDEKNLAQLHLGQKALASADAFPQSRFQAELFYINPGIDALRGAVEVKLRVPQPPDYLRQDMTVSVDIEVGRRADAVTIPSGAIFDAAGAAPWVLVVDGSHAVKRPVGLGLRGEGRTEIVSGLGAGDRVVAAAGAGIAPGQRVRGAKVAASGAR